MTNETTASERERLKPCPFCGGDASQRTEHDSDMVRWGYIGCRCGVRTRGKFGDLCPITWAEIRAEWNARAALPAPADQPQGSSGSLSESGVEARTQDAASASGSLSEIRRTAQVAEAAWWCKNAVRHVRFVSIDAASSIDDRAAAVRAAEEAIDKLAALL